MSAAAWNARADARNGSRELSRASPSFDADSASQARESFEPLPVWLAIREADMDVRAHAMVSIAKRRRLEVPKLPWKKSRRVFQSSIEHFLTFEPQVGSKES